MPIKNCEQIISQYLSGNWQKFFKIWNTSFPSDVKESIEHKILTLKLRIHYAILPIRIFQLHQNVNCAFNCSNKVSEILKNVADQYSKLEDEKELNEKRNKLTTDSMKQLECFLNSNDGQKLMTELKDSSFMIFFALPNIVNPLEDKSVNTIFSIHWLEQLTIDLEKFLRKFFQHQLLLSKQEIKNQALNVNKSEVTSGIKNLSSINSYSDVANDHKSEISNVINNNEIIHSTFKNDQIKNSMTHHQNVIEDNKIFKNEPHHIMNIVTPNIFTTRKYCICNDELNITKSHLLNLHKHYKKLKLRFHKLHEDYQIMNEVAEILAISLENSVQGKPINLDLILKSRLKIFPDRFNTIIHTDPEISSIDLKEDVLKDIFITDDDQNIIKNVIVPPKLLDYKKIKFHLKYGDMKTKLLLLQALRQKITSNQAENRNDIIHEYIKNDLLGLEENIMDSTVNNNLFHLLHPVNVKTSVNLIQQTTSRLLNTLASFSSGRLYLSSSSLVLDIILVYLDSCNIDTCDNVTIDMLIAALQKMSLRKKQRNYMIETNLVEWIIYHLSTEYLKMRLYRLEYTCALLMNLSLNSAARTRVSTIASVFISTMINLLSTNCTLILPYINGALQNFLLNNEINQEAKKLHLIEILEYQCINNEEDLRNQFLHTMKIHERECNESLSDDDELPDEDDDLFNILENELEENDPIQVSKGELQGENLLTTHYSVSTFFSQSIELSTQNLCSVSTEKNDNYSSIENTTSETRYYESKIESLEKKSGAEVVNSSKNILNTNKTETKSQTKEEEEDAFLAKPKILRTPPPARAIRNRAKSSAKKIK